MIYIVLYTLNKSLLVREVRLKQASNKHVNNLQQCCYFITVVSINGSKSCQMSFRAGKEAKSIILWYRFSTSVNPTDLIVYWI